MTRARKESALHLALLVLAQFISLAVVILNATALYLSRHTGIVKTYASPADYVLLILGTASFVGSTAFLFLHLHLYFRIMDDQPFSPPKTLSATEVIIAVISIALWTVSTSVILTHSQASAAPCRFTSSFYTLNHSDICELFDTTLMLAFAAVGSWVLVLLATLITLIRSPIPPTTIFTIEAPPQRFSQPMLVSSPMNTSASNLYLDASSSSRPYYLGNRNGETPSSYIVLDKKEDTNNFYAYYQPQYVLSSHNNSSNATSSSYYSTLPHVDTQRSIQSLSTIESIYTGFQPLKIELPMIQVGAFDVSFTRQ